MAALPTLTVTIIAGLLAANACSSSTTTQAGSDETGGDAGLGGSVSGNGGNNGGGSTAVGGSVSTAGAGAPSTELSCSAYCTRVQANCATDSVVQYKSTTSCMNSCAAFRLGTLTDTAGNTLGCRTHFAELAAANPLANCAAAGPSGGGKCGTNCDAYCALMSAVCPLVYEDDAVCRAACTPMTGVDVIGYTSGGSGDNLQCRIYHATFAAEGFAEIHCTHAASVPAAPCAG